MSTTCNRRMQLVCILLSHLLVAMENANASSNSEQKYELDLIHEQIGFLLDENHNQNHEIAALKKIVRAQGGSFQPMRAKEGGMEDSITTHLHDSTEIAGRGKRPVRLLPAYMFERPKNETAQPPRFYGPPTNCSDLSRLGYTLNGFYTITPSPVNLSSTTNEITKLETVYCSFKQPEGTFNSSLVEKRISHLKLDSNIISNSLARPVIIETGIHFHVFRTEYHKKLGYKKPMRQVTTFDKVFLNMGGNFIEKSGWFIAPISGVYQFICTTVMASIPKNADPSAIVEFELTKVDSISKDEEAVSQSTTKEAGNSMVISATLKLKKGDKIYMIATQGGGYEVKWASLTGSLMKAE